MAFLDNLSEQNQRQTKREWDQLSETRSRHRPNDTTAISIWDREFYSSMEPAGLVSPTAVDPYFSLGTVISGLSSLFEVTFGISFSIVPPAPNEAFWHSSVRKLQVRDEAHGTLGYIYCDLFERAHKPQGPAHYTIRCSRRTDDDQEAADLDVEPSAPALDLLVVPGADAKAGQAGTYQLPISVLSCDFPRGSGRTLLSWRQVEVIFHEVGHALHCEPRCLPSPPCLRRRAYTAMLGQTEYHNVSGTRCATDFVELPSILMEHFCSSPQVLQLYARHHKTGAALPLTSLQQIQALARAGEGFEQSRQITLAALDQVYHSSAPSQPGFDSTATYYDVVERFAPFGSAKGLRESGTNWQVQFTHLVGYGASYYAYLFDRAIANQVWKQVFAASGGLDRAAGERYRKEVLSFGGGKDPWECLAALLENDKLARGGAEAMAEVGRWGIQEH
jgi:intermediate peptidase